jgi:hypothetical protein
MNCSPATSRIVYFQEPSFSLPAWFTARLHAAIRRGALGADFESGRDAVSKTFAAGSACGFWPDHLGRRGPLVTAEVYGFDEAALGRFCDALELEAEVEGSDASLWNPSPDFEGYKATTLITFKPKG